VHFRRKTIVHEIITYIEVGLRIRVASWRSSLGHEAQHGEVAYLLLVVDLLILFQTWWVFTWEVEVTQGYTCLRHDLLNVLLLVPEPILLLVVILVIVVILVGSIVLVGIVVLLPLGAVGDKVGGVATLKTTPRVSW
jgi:hypothetical protein